MAQRPGTTSKTGSKRQSAKTVEAGIGVYRAMRNKALRIPWRDFAAERDKLIHWRTFALWARAIAEAEHGIPSALRKVLERECPGFLVGRDTGAYATLWDDLSAWIDQHVFLEANKAGYLDALHYYAGSDPRSEQAWAHWTRTADAWRTRKPTRYPTFQAWSRATEKHPAIAPTVVDAFIEWDAFAFWARVAIVAARHLPEPVAGEVENRCPGFLRQFGDTISPRTAMQFWTELLTWIEANHFAGAGIQALRVAARSHLRSERINRYRTECEYAWRRNPPDPFPTFEQWLQDADAFVVGGRRQTSPRP